MKRLRSAVGRVVHREDRLLDRVAVRQSAVGLDREADVDREPCGLRRAHDPDGLVGVRQRERRRLSAPGVGDCPELDRVVLARPRPRSIRSVGAIRVAARSDARLDDDAAALHRLEHVVAHGLDERDGAAVDRSEVVGLVAEQAAPVGLARQVGAESTSGTLRSRASSRNGV